LAIAGTGEIHTAAADLTINTSKTCELIDVTEEVESLVASSPVTTGIVLVSTPHTTCAVIVNELEPGFANDLARTLEELAPPGRDYDHNDAPHAEEFEAPNGYAHVRAALLSSPSVLLPVREGCLALGRWQRVFLVELDRARPRTVNVTLLGSDS
jgi:secondary thiamine-phosphate synthase enzyme